METRIIDMSKMFGKSEIAVYDNIKRVINEDNVITFTFFVVLPVICVYNILDLIKL